MIRLFFMVLVGALFSGVLYSNQEQMVTLQFFWGMETNPIRLYLIVLGAFLIGLLFSILIFVPGWIRSMFDRRRKSKRIEQLEIDIDRIRSEVLQQNAPALSNTGIEETDKD